MSGEDLKNTHKYLIYARVTITFLQYSYFFVVLLAVDIPFKVVGIIQKFAKLAPQNKIAFSKYIEVGRVMKVSFKRVTGYSLKLTRLTREQFLKFLFSVGVLVSSFTQPARCAVTGLSLIDFSTRVLLTSPKLSPE